MNRTMLIIAPLLFSTVTWSADKGALSEAQKQYQQDRAYCMSGQSYQDRTTCLREAGAALQEAKRGQLSENEGAYQQNQLARCSYLRGDDQRDCERRMRGEGTVSGSVEGGGIYRELRTVVPAEESSTGSSGGIMQRPLK